MNWIITGLVVACSTLFAVWQDNIYAGFWFLTLCLYLVMNTNEVIRIWQVYREEEIKLMKKKFAIKERKLNER